MTKADKEGQRKAPILRFKGFTDDWEQRKLGEIFKFSQGLQVPIDQQFERKEENTERFIRIVDVTQDNIPQRFVYNPTGKGRVNLDDIFFVRYGAVGTIGHGFKGVIANNLFKVIPLIDINPLFWFYQFSDIRFNSRLKALSASTSMPAINFNTLRKMIISNTSIVEQNKIGTILKSLDNLLTLYERKLKLLSQVKKYFLDNLFTEKEYPNLRFKGFTDAWEQRQLRKLAKLITKGTTPQKYDGNINFIKVENIEEVSINPKAKILESEHLGKLKRSILKENDILFSIAGSLGKVGLVNSAILPANTNQALAIIRLSESKDIEYNYIFNYLRSNYIQHFIRRLPSVGAQPNLSLKQINELVIKFPNYCEQQKISNMLDRLNNILTLYENKQQHLTEIKNTLLNTMFI